MFYILKISGDNPFGLLLFLGAVAIFIFAELGCTKSQIPAYVFVNDVFAVNYYVP